MKKFWEYEKGMEETMITIGVQMTLNASQTAGIFAYKFAKKGYETYISEDEYFVIVHVRKHEFFNSVHLPKKYKRTINEIDKLFYEMERALA